VEKKYISKTLLLKLKKLKGFLNFNVTSTGVLILFYNDNIVKIPLGKVSRGSLDDNWSNYQLLKKSELNPYVNYRLEKVLGYYTMEKLLEVSLSLSDLDIIIEDIERSAKLSLSSNNIYVLSAVHQTKIFRRDLSRIIVIFEDRKVNGAAMHADLTSSNIMINRDREKVLIDLDRFTFEGVANYDRIHFYIDKESKTMKISFFQYLTMIITNKKKSEFSQFDLFVYFLLRVSFEDNNINIGDHYYSNVLKLNTLFLNKLNA
jgi:serine/threonine protein kinase